MPYPREDDTTEDTFYHYSSVSCRTNRTLLRDYVQVHVYFGLIQMASPQLIISDGTWTMGGWFLQTLNS
jgi:hypothetical protein